MEFSRLTQFGVLRFEGADATAFLQGQLTCNVQALENARSQYGGYCTPKGRLLATFLLCKNDDAYYMMLPRELCEPIRKRLSMYILRSKVKATDASSELTLLGLAGLGADDMIARLAGLVPPQPHHATLSDDVMALRLPPHRYLIIAPEKRVAETEFSNATSCDPVFWNQLDIAAGVPMILSATQEQFVPQTVNLDLIGAVSFDKGCYPGQEIVARAHYLGRIKQRMTLAHLAGDTPPCPGDKLYSPSFGDQASGMIVNATPARDGGFDALAVVQTADIASADIHWKAPDGPAWSLRALPYTLS
jgi:tRNA-modifying protein YgfZ